MYSVGSTETIIKTTVKKIIQILFLLQLVRAGNFCKEQTAWLYLHIRVAAPSPVLPAKKVLAATIPPARRLQVRMCLFFKTTI